jgi:spore coat polysaccharide biosynthesis protein SpsF
MRIGVIILCRYGSSRLPGKILKQINGKAILAYIYEKFQLVLHNDDILIATSDDKSDDIIEQYCKDQQFNYFRGSLDNVADRFLSAAQHSDFDYAVRINGDNLFIDITSFLDMMDICRAHDFDFISNVKGRTFPYGMSIEFVKTSFYKNLQSQLLKDERYREHVTLYLYENENEGLQFHYKNERCEALKGVHLAIDELGDFQLAEKLMKGLGSDYYNFGLRHLNMIYQNVTHEK